MRKGKELNLPRSAAAPWGEMELCSLIRMHEAGETYAAMGKRLNRTKDSVCWKLKELRKKGMVK